MVTWRDLHGSVSENRPMGPHWTATNETRVRVRRTLQGVTLSFGDALFLRFLQQLLGFEFLPLLTAPAPASWYVCLQCVHLSLWIHPRALTYSFFQKTLKRVSFTREDGRVLSLGLRAVVRNRFCKPGVNKYMREYIAWIVVCSTQIILSMVHSHQLSPERLVFVHFTYWYDIT